MITTKLIRIIEKNWTKWTIIAKLKPTERSSLKVITANKTDASKTPTPAGEDGREELNATNHRLKNPKVIGLCRFKS